MLNREPVALTVTGKGSDFAVEVGGRRIAIETDWQPGDPLFHGKVDGQVVAVQVDAVGSGWRLIHEGGQAEALVLTPRQAELYALMPVKAAPDTSKFLLSPMPGLLASVAVSEGQEVKAGEALAVVEAMKMENVLRAVQDGTVKVLHAKAGDSLQGRPEDPRVRLSRWRCRPASPSPAGSRASAIATGRSPPAGASASPAGCATAATAPSRR